MKIEIVLEEKLEVIEKVEDYEQVKVNDQLVDEFEIMETDENECDYKNNLNLVEMIKKKIKIIFLKNK